MKARAIGPASQRPACHPAAALLALPTLQVPISRIVALNKPELPAAITGMLGSAGLGMMMPGFAIAFSSILAVFYGPGELQGRAMPDF